METAYIVLIVLLTIYLPLYFYVRHNKKLRERGVQPYGPTIMIKTTWGLKLMDRLSKHRRFWNFFGLASKIIALFLMVGIMVVMTINMLLLPAAIGRTGIGIQYALAIPGLNPMLPLVYGVIGLVVAMAVHELAHGIQTRANDMRVKSSGLLYAVVPVGAFVEPDEEDVAKGGRKARMDLYAAGIAMNFIVGMLCFALMIAAMSGGLTSNYGGNPAVTSIEGGTYAYDSGIPAGAVITYVDDLSGGGPVLIDSMGAFRGVADAYGEYEITYVYKETTGTVRTTLGVHIAGVSSGTPAYDAGVRNDTYLMAMNNLSRATGWVDFGNIYDFKDFMNGTRGGDRCSLRVIGTETGSVPSELSLTLTDNRGIGFLGVSVNTSGFVFTTPDESLARAMNPLHGATSITEGAMSVLAYIGAPLSGYAPIPASTQWWYESDVIPQDVFWVLMSVLFWIFWLNLVIGMSNALPAIPFDGGFLFMGGVDYILEKSKIPAERRERYAGSLTGMISWIVILELLLVMLVIIF